MWKDYELPKIALIDGVEYKINTDYRQILDILKLMNNTELTESEVFYCCASWFYDDIDSIENKDEAYRLMCLFINGNKEESKSKKKALMSWEQDISLIIPPINRVVNKDIREIGYLHWWSFLGAFMEIGECTFNTYVGIRDKKSRGKKLDKEEERIFKENRSDIELKNKVSAEDQALIDQLLGR